MDTILFTCSLTEQEGRALAHAFRGRSLTIMGGLDRFRPEDEALRKILVALKAWERGWMAPPFS